jgi:hypothetical protein
MFYATPCLGNAFQRAVHQHQNQAMWILGSDAAVDRNALVSGKLVSQGVGIHSSLLL